MIRAWPLILLVLLVPASALSDTSDLEGGVFIAHHPPGLQYSAGEDYCQRWFQDLGIDSCSEQNNRIDLDGNQGQSSVWFVIAAWDEAKEWCGAEFGFAAYDSTIYLFQQWGPCPASALSIPTPGWPGPNRGVAISLPDTTWSGNFVPVYWFAGYTYYEGEIPLAANPSSEFGGTANCEMPPQSWAASAFGGIGILQDGTYACPEGLDGGDGLDGGTQPDGADGYGGYEGDQGQGGEADSVACCFGSECRILPADECERLGGLVRPGWAGCDLEPCRNALADGAGDLPPRALYPLVTRTVRADTSPAVFYLDPGNDNLIAFHLCTMQPDAGTTTLSWALYDPRQEGGNPIYSADNLSVGFPGLDFSGIQWGRASGMAELVITTLAGFGNYYAFSPLDMADPDDTDHEYFNGNIVAYPGDGIAPWSWTGHYRFFVPTMAAWMRLALFYDGGGDWYSTHWLLRDPDGQVVLGMGQGYLYTDEVPENLRGREWEIEVTSTPGAPGDPYGLLRVDFASQGESGPAVWWTPDFAFDTTPENPVRAQFSPWDVFSVYDESFEYANVAYYAPYGAPDQGYQEQGLDPTAKLIWTGQRRLVFGAYLGTEREVCLSWLGGAERVDFTWWTNFDSTVRWDSVSTHARTWSQPIPAGGLLFVHLLRPWAVDISTDAPLAACGPAHALTWGRQATGPGASQDITFFVPTDLSVLRLTFEAWQWCREQGAGDCVEQPGVMLNRVYPTARVVLTDPAGGSHSFWVGPQTHGLAEIALPLAGQLESCRGHAWQLHVETGEAQGDIKASVLLGNDLSPYVTWVQERERLILPMARPIPPRMVHDVSSYSYEWQVIPPADLYFASEGTCRLYQNAWHCLPLSSPASQSLARWVIPGGQAHKEVLCTEYGPWLPTAMYAGFADSMRTTPEPVYAVPHPLGQAADGSLSTTISGVPDEPKKHLVLSAISKGQPTPPDPDGLASLSATAGAGFENGSVGWGRTGENLDPGWADIAHQQFDIIPDLGIQGVWAQGLNLDLIHESAAVLAGRGHVLSTGIADEPMQKGACDPDVLREAAYQVRLEDQRHPIGIHDEPDLLYTGEMRDIVDTWSDDQYSKRWLKGSNKWMFPSCEVVTMIREIEARVRAGTTVALVLQGGFPDWPNEQGKPPHADHYVAARRDTLGAEMLSALLVGADVVGVFCKNFNDWDSQVNLQVRNAALWDSLPAITSVWEKVERWMRAEVVFDSGVRGAPVQECEWPPVTFGYGLWLEDADEGRVGRWFAFCNLARGTTWDDVISWGDLVMAYDPAASLEYDGWSMATSSPSPEQMAWINEAGLHLHLPPGKWVVGRVVLQMDPLEVEEMRGGSDVLSVAAIPNPSGPMTEFEVRSGRQRGVRLTLFDVSGRLVRDILAQVQPGSNRLRWDGLCSNGDRAPSGLFRALMQDEGGGGRRSCWVLRLK